MVAELPGGKQANGVVCLGMGLSVEHPAQHHNQHNHQNPAASAQSDEPIAALLICGLGSGILASADISILLLGIL